MEYMVPLKLILAVCLTGLARAEYNIKDFGMTNRTFNCPVPDGCPPYTEKYLTNYRYMNPTPDKTCTIGDIEAALRKFQEFNIGRVGTVSGTCDNETLALFTTPRCGCEDMNKDDPKKMMPANFYGPQAFQVGSKWSKTHLKWKVTKYSSRNRLSRTQIDDTMKRALDLWAQQTTLTFEQVSETSPADIDIRFEVGRHTPEGYDFDGRSPNGPVLAHAFFPENGRVHFDDDENFVLNTNQGTELYIVAAHEFGHTLGIAHSNINEALMAPFYRYSENLVLHNDDVRAIQTHYGAGTKPEVRTTPAPPRPVPTTARPNMPDYCNMKIQASFKISATTFVFTNDPSDNYRTVVYKVSSRGGLDPSSRMSLSDLFKKNSAGRWPRAHPYRVDAAAYVPNKRYIFLLSGTRAYRYTMNNYNGPFFLDEQADFPKWMNVDEFPERPRAAVPMPLPGSRYYMLIFGKTMVWDWDFETQRVGAWAYPISSFGRNMPTNVHAAFLDNAETLAFIKNDQYIKFNLRYRRVMDDGNSIQSVKRDFFRQQCV